MSVSIEVRQLKPKDYGYVHTKPDEFENATFSLVFEEIATEIIWLLSRKHFQKGPFYVMKTPF